MSGDRVPAVDRGRCQGHGKCYLFLPDVFEVADDYGHAEARTAIDVSDPTLRARIDDAIRNCPEDAISWRNASRHEREGA